MNHGSPIKKLATVLFIVLRDRPKRRAALHETTCLETSRGLAIHGAALAFVN
jgi:hypothetical protein